jgi:hypothetical protein
MLHLEETWELGKGRLEVNDVLMALIGSAAMVAIFVVFVIAASRNR